jgi:thioredoxin-related protein
MLSRSLTAILTILILLTANIARAEQYNDALKRASKQDKPVILYFYSNYCTYCAAMDRDTLSDVEIKRTLVADIVYYRVNVDHQEQIARKYSVRGYPTTWLLEPTGKPIAAIPGYVEKRDFRKVLSYLKGRHYKTMKLWDFLGKV